MFVVEQVAVLVTRSVAALLAGIAAVINAVVVAVTAAAGHFQGRTDGQQQENPFHEVNSFREVGDYG